MPNLTVFSVTALLLGGGLVAASADVVALEPLKDNTLYQDPTGSLSNGAGSAMFAGRSSQTSNSIRRALVAFDIAGAIPAGSTIDSVSLALTNSASNTNNDSIALYRVLADWGEGTSVASGGQGGGAPATPGDATWLHRSFNSILWSNPGGDFSAVASAATDVAGPGVYTWGSAGMVADVQSFLDAPSDNYGWILLGNEAVSGSAKKFSTGEEPDVDARPRLVVAFTIPEPATGLVIALATIGTIATRRR